MPRPSDPIRQAEQTTNDVWNTMRRLDQIADRISKQKVKFLKGKARRIERRILLRSLLDTWDKVAGHFKRPIH